MFVIAAPAKKIIFTVSMVKNEADIIETFVRYHLAIVDGMAILDNCSTDGTTQILEKLAQEGLPVYLVKDTDTAYRQAEKTTKLLYDTIEQYHPDVVIPLDSDEFIFAPDGDNPRRYLKNLREDTLYFWDVYDFSPLRKNAKFALENFTRRNRQKTFSKVFSPPHSCKHTVFHFRKAITTSASSSKAYIFRLRPYRDSIAIMTEPLALERTSPLIYRRFSKPRAKKERMQGNFYLNSRWRISPTALLSR